MATSSAIQLSGLDVVNNDQQPNGGLSSSVDPTPAGVDANVSHEVDIVVKDEAGSNDKEIEQSVSLFPHSPVHLTWDDLRVSMPLRGQVPKNSVEKVEMKEILHGITGGAHPGEMIAIMGSSGAGKTTLLNALSGRMQAGELGGKILMNGKKRDQRFKRVAAFVQQTDELLPNLTVRETLYFAAYLRLPATVSRKDKENAAEGVIRELGLELCADNLIGSALSPGISGGEKRRVSMGVEMITYPNLIFADEPTSGLDSTTSYRVISTIKRLAMRDRTVLVTIHQPKAKIFHMFDKVIILSQGKQVFFGSPKDCLEFFAKYGFPVPELTNPADHYLDVTTLDGDSEEGDREILKRVDMLAERYAIDAKDGRYAYKEETSMRLLSDKAGDNDDDDDGAKFANGWMEETLLLMNRNFINFRREKITTVVALVQSVFIGLLVGFVFFQLGRSQTDVQNRAGVLFFVTVNQSFQPIFQIITVFTAERPVFRRERAAASYRVSSYFLAKNISEFPVQIFFPFVMSTIAYFLVGLQSDASRYFTFCAITMTMCITSQSLGLWIASFAPNVQVAQIITPMIIVVFMLFGGLFLNDSDVQPWFLWIKWISYINYGFRSFMLNEFRDLNFDPSLCKPGQCFLKGDDVIELYNVGGISIGTCIGILWSMALFFRVMAYISLRKRDKPMLKLD